MIFMTNVMKETKMHSSEKLREICKELGIEIIKIGFKNFIKEEDVPNLKEHIMKKRKENKRTNEQKLSNDEIRKRIEIASIYKYRHGNNANLFLLKELE